MSNIRPRRCPLTVAALLLGAWLPMVGVAGSLEGKDWQLLQFRGDDGLTDLTSPENPNPWRFEAGRLSGSAGCNQLLGAYQLDGGALSFEPNIAGTMMACPPPLMEQEQAVTQTLDEVAGFELNAEGLTLTDADGLPLLRFGELKAAPLTGTTWRLTRYNNGKQAVTTVLRDTEILLILSADGRFSGKACNNYRGGYRAEGDEFVLDGPIAATRMLCPGPEGANEQEGAYFAALERTARYRISGDELVLLDADGSLQGEFRALKPQSEPGPETARPSAN
jgi:heat shock protein HslJ